MNSAGRDQRFHPLVIYLPSPTHLGVVLGGISKVPGHKAGPLLSHWIGFFPYSSPAASRSRNGFRSKRTKDYGDQGRTVDSSDGELAIVLRPRHAGRQEELNRKIGEVKAMLGEINLPLWFVPNDPHNLMYHF
jgi:hypothetical protein